MPRKRHGLCHLKGDSLSAHGVRREPHPKDARLFMPGGHNAAPAGRKPRQRRGTFRAQRTRETFQPLFLCAAKKKPLAVKRKRQRGDFDFPPFAIPLKTTKKRADAPFLDHSRGLACAKAYFKSTKRDADAPLTDRRGSRNTLRCSRADSTRKGCAASVALLRR